MSADETIVLHVMPADRAEPLSLRQIIHRLIDTFPQVLVDWEEGRRRAEMIVEKLREMDAPDHIIDAATPPEGEHASGLVQVCDGGDETCVDLLLKLGEPAFMVTGAGEARVRDMATRIADSLGYEVAAS